MLAEALEEQARGYMTAGRTLEATAAAEEAIACNIEQISSGPALNARVTLATALANLGDDRGLAMLAEAADEADRLNESRALMRALNNIPHVSLMAGRLVESHQAWELSRSEWPASPRRSPRPGSCRTARPGPSRWATGRRRRSSSRNTTA